jgi:hypothetical protein
MIKIYANYKNGDAEASLLRAMRPFGTLLAILVFAYVAVGMPMPSDTPATFAGPFRQIAKISCVGAVGLLLAVWVGGYDAPNGTVAIKWVIGQIVAACFTFVIVAAICIALSAFNA